MLLEIKGMSDSLSVIGEFEDNLKFLLRNKSDEASIYLTKKELMSYIAKSILVVSHVYLTSLTDDITVLRDKKAAISLLPEPSKPSMYMLSKKLAVKYIEKALCIAVKIYEKDRELLRGVVEDLDLWRIHDDCALLTYAELMDRAVIDDLNLNINDHTAALKENFPVGLDRKGHACGGNFEGVENV
jgi:hypothetical protein